MTYDPKCPLPANPSAEDVRLRFEELDANMDRHYEQGMWDAQIVAAVLVQEARAALLAALTGEGK